MVEVEDLRPLDLFEGLTDQQLAELAGASDEVVIQPAEVLFREGDPADAWWVLVAGAIDLVRYVGQEQLIVARMRTPGQWAGGFRAWDASGVYLATGIVAQPGQVLRVPGIVLRRTADAWFPFGVHLIEGMFTTVRSIEATARQRESLVTLGKLAAGLAHELNNPAAAATRAVDALEAASADMRTSLARLAAAQITPGQLAELDLLRKRAAAAPLGALALADREDDLSAWLEDHGVDQAWILGPALAAVGVDRSWCEEAAAALGSSALGPGLEWVTSTASIDTLLAEVKESTGRISRLVGAMKSYSQMDRASLQRIDLTEGLESTLVMLGHKIPDGVHVVRDYPERTPTVVAYPGELNQVWTNLIDNALDAMGGAGTLRVTTRAEGEGGALVEIADTGPGIPPAIAARVFEPFFTTKGVGKGTGLGLDIARRIVEERHGGTIEIVSGPGDTVLRVHLPARARQA